MSTAQQKLVRLDDATLSNLLQNKAVVDRFPFLSHMAKSVKTTRGCGSCGGGRSRGERLDFNGVRKTIANMQPAEQDVFKKLLNTSRVRVYYTDDRGKVQPVTF